MVKRPLPHRIQKTTIFFVIALAALGAVGVMTTMITTATTADAAKTCHANPNSGVSVCPPGAGKGEGGFICNPGKCGVIQPN